jgi:hypothetical protein
MRKNCLTLVSTLLVIVVVLTACKEDRKSQPTQLDAPFLNATATPGPGPTSTPWPTAWPTATRPAVTPSSTPLPYPTRDRSQSTEEPIDNTIVPGDWLQATFRDTDNQDRALAEFLGRAVVVHTLAASCEVCIEQQRELLAAIQDRYQYQDLTNPVFVALGVAAGETPSLLQTGLSAGLGDTWTELQALLAQDDVSASYVVGVASQDLLDALARDFGPDATEPNASTIIVIEPDGYAHVMYPGLVVMRDLRDAISFYGNLAPGGDE